MPKVECVVGTCVPRRGVQAVCLVLRGGASVSCGSSRFLVDGKTKLRWSSSWNEHDGTRTGLLQSLPSSCVRG